MAAEINVYQLIAPKFWDIYDDMQRGDHAEYMEKGGRGSTKSSRISISIVTGMLQDPLANAIIYRQVANTIKDSVYAQMLWTIDQLGIDSICKLRTSPFEIIFKPIVVRKASLLRRRFSHAISPPSEGFTPLHPFVKRVGVKVCACIKSSMLGNEKYKGCALLQKHYTADYLTKKIVRERRCGSAVLRRRLPRGHHRSCDF